MFSLVEARAVTCDGPTSGISKCGRLQAVLHRFTHRLRFLAASVCWIGFFGRFSPICMKGYGHYEHRRPAFVSSFNTVAFRRLMYCRCFSEWQTPVFSSTSLSAARPQAASFLRCVQLSLRRCCCRCRASPLINAPHPLLLSLFHLTSDAISAAVLQG